jgi:hypothetical protein
VEVEPAGGRASTHKKKNNKENKKRPSEEEPAAQRSKRVEEPAAKRRKNNQEDEEPREAGRSRELETQESEKPRDRGYSVRAVRGKSGTAHPKKHIEKMASQRASQQKSIGAENSSLAPTSLARLFGEDEDIMEIDSSA